MSEYPKIRTAHRKIKNIVGAFPVSLPTIGIRVGCPFAESDHQKRWRTHAHVFCQPDTICVCRDFELLPEGHKLGILAHEYGHLIAMQEWNDDSEPGADRAYTKFSGMPIEYRTEHRLQFIDPLLIENRSHRIANPMLRRGQRAHIISRAKELLADKPFAPYIDTLFDTSDRDASLIIYREVEKNIPPLERTAELFRENHPAYGEMGSGKYGSVYSDYEPFPLAYKYGNISTHEFETQREASELGVAPYPYDYEIRKMSGIKGPRSIPIKYGEGAFRMQLLSGFITLAELRKTGTNEDIEKAENNAVDALFKLQLAGISHNDLHSYNIMVRPSDLRVMIIDFGQSIKSYLSVVTDLWGPNTRNLLMRVARRVSHQHEKEVEKKIESLFGQVARKVSPRSSSNPQILHKAVAYLSESNPSALARHEAYARKKIIQFQQWYNQLLNRG